MSLTPNPNRKLVFSLPPSPNPFLTPRFEKRPLDLRWADGSSTVNRHERDKEVNIQVILRCRPLSDEEQRLSVQKVISCNEQKKEVTVMQSFFNRQADKTFTFDKVFGPKSQQRSIYDQAISPIVNDVLEGFNCTVFAYGQTGTGKTYTMEGPMKSKGADLSAEDGIIPRAVRHIFDILEARKADYSMKVTFLELYNEEITDLLAPEDHAKFMEDRQRRAISLMEDGKGGAVIRGLKEEVVYSANDVYSLLECGSAKRRTADTFLNKQSSRSHSIFSLTIHVKEAAIGNEELIKCGRLNLVDLAGSENISRSGAREGRAREAGELNKSLLTLGRVITALVDHSGHIPYRDSKLTRLLRESLGGKAKTCIIATVSPSVHCLEETLSTLDYAYRAKSIKNKPEANQKLSKCVLLKDLYAQLERLKEDVRAAREKNGVYISHERFAKDEAEKKVMNETIEQLEIDLGLKSKQADRFQELCHAEQERNLDLECEIKECKASLESSKRAFVDLEEVQKKTSLMVKEKEFIILNLLQSEDAILERAKELRDSLENASEDMSMLLAKMDHKVKIETENNGIIQTFGCQLDQSLDNLHKTVIGSVCEQHEVLRSMEEHANSFITTKHEAAKCLESRIEKVKDIYTTGIMGMKELTSTLKKKAFTDLEQMKLTICSQILAVENFLATAVSEAEQVLNVVQRSLTEQKELLAFLAQQQEAALQSTLISTQAISKTTIDFFNDLQSRVSRIMAFMEETETERSCRLADFDKKFKEVSAREERTAFEKIGGILRDLTALKANMVSEAVENMKDTTLEAKKKLQRDMESLQQVSDNAKNEWIANTEKMEIQFQEDASTTSETRAKMENILKNCSEKVVQSMQLWENAQLSVDQLNKDYATAITSSIETIDQENNNVFEEIASISANTSVEFNSATCDLMTSANNSLMLDHEAKKEMESMSLSCSGHLKTLQGNHTESIKDIKKLADRYLSKEYMVDHPTGTTPIVKNIKVPSLASIEALRTPSMGTEMGSENKLREAEGKQQSFIAVNSQIARSPLMPVN